jgi:hypothetical protein
MSNEKTWLTGDQSWQKAARRSVEIEVDAPRRLALAAEICGCRVPPPPAPGWWPDLSKETVDTDEEALAELWGFFLHHSPRLDERPEPLTSTQQAELLLLIDDVAILLAHVDGADEIAKECHLDRETILQMRRVKALDAARTLRGENDALLDRAVYLDPRHDSAPLLASSALAALREWAVEAAPRKAGRPQSAEVALALEIAEYAGEIMPRLARKACCRVASVLVAGNETLTASLYERGRPMRKRRE